MGRLVANLRQKVRADAARLVPCDVAAPKRFAFLALHPGFRALLLERVQELASEAQWNLAEQVVLNLNHFLSGAEFRPGCRIGPGAIVRHPAAIVIGSGVTIGADCTLQHGVTLGEKYIDARSNGQYPSVGSRVTFGTHAVVVGDISIGDDAVIGALTFVDHDVQSGVTVVSHRETRSRRVGE